MSYEVDKENVLNSMQSSFGELLECVRQIAREEAEAAASSQPDESDSSAEPAAASIECVIEQAEQICSSDAWSRQFEQRIQESFQKVLPSLIKRFRAEMDKALESGSAGGGAGAGIDDVINSVEMKEMLEERFRSMLLYLKQEVIPKAVQQA